MSDFTDAIAAGMREKNPVLKPWQPSGRVVCWRDDDGALRVIGLMDSSELATEVCQAHNEALTGKAT